MKVRRTYKYRMYDSKQNKHLDEALSIAAEIWNHCIALHRRYYRMYGKYLNSYKLKNHITKLKRLPKYKHWNMLGSQAIQDIVERIDKSYEAFFKHVREKRRGRKSPPKFKKRKNYSSFTLKQAGYKFQEGTNRVTIMGHTYKYVAHRPFWGDIKTVTVKRDKLGKYYLFISVIQIWPDTTPRAGNAVGMDFGLKTFLTLNDGTKIESPLWFTSALKDIQKANRDLSHCKPKSNNRNRAKLALERKHKRVSNQRNDWFFKLADSLTKQYSDIFIEDLDIEGMKRLWGRKVSDLAFSDFVKILHWEGLKNNCTTKEIDRWFPSSKTCHACGYIHKELSLKEREWVCPACGVLHDRDVNAAINIREYGFSMRTA